MDTYLYDAYGKTIATFYKPHRYGGKYGYHSNLNAAGFILAGQRWYSPHLRRWISRDPIGYEGDDNLYEYVGGKPTTRVDPTGLLPVPALVEGGAAILGPAAGPALAAVGPVVGEAALYAGVVMSGGAVVACLIDKQACENLLLLLRSYRRARRR